MCSSDLASGFLLPRRRLHSSGEASFLILPLLHYAHLSERGVCSVLNRTRIIHVFALCYLATTGCLATPQPIVVSQTPGQLVEVRYDARAGNGHSHPHTLTVSQMTSILKGIQVYDRDLVGTAGILMGCDAVPALTEDRKSIRLNSSR